MLCGGEDVSSSFVLACCKNPLVNVSGKGGQSYVFLLYPAKTYRKTDGPLLIGSLNTSQSLELEENYKQKENPHTPLFSASETMTGTQ